MPIVSAGADVFEGMRHWADKAPTVNQKGAPTGPWGPVARAVDRTSLGEIYAEGYNLDIFRHLILAIMDLDVSVKCDERKK